MKFRHRLPRPPEEHPAVKYIVLGLVIVFGLLGSYMFKVITDHDKEIRAIHTQRALDCDKLNLEYGKYYVVVDGFYKNTKLVAFEYGTEVVTLKIFMTEDIVKFYCADLKPLEN